MKLLITKGTTSKIQHIFISNSSKKDGSGLTGLGYNSTGLTAYYLRPGDSTATQVTLQDITTLGTYVSGGFKEVDATNLPGIYELHLPDAALATGADQVIVMLKGATNMAPCLLEIQLTDLDLNNSTVNLSSATETQIDAIETDTNEMQGKLPTGTISDFDAATDAVATVTSVTNDVGVTQAGADKVWSSAARTLTSFGTLVSDIWDALTSGLTTAGSIGKLLVDNINATISSRSTFSPASDTVATVTSVTNDVGVTQAGADKVWSSAARTLTSFGTLVSDIWDALTSGLTTAGSIGKLLVDNINATISSRSTFNPASDTVATVTSVTNDVGVTQAGADKVWSSATRTLTSFGTLIADIWSNTTRRITGLLGADLTETTAGRVAGNMSTFWDNADAATTKTVDDVGSGGSGLTQQQVRDAMKLAPTGGAPAAGSVDEHLDDASTFDPATDAVATVTSVANDVGVTQAGADKVWSSATRTLTSFGTLIADIWSNTTRRITGLLGADLTETTAGRVAGNMSTFWDNADAATTKTVDDVGSGGGGSGETQLRSGTAQAGGASTITLDSGASATDDHYKHAICAITGGTGAGQSQIIDSYVGSTKVATMAASWAVAPDATSQFVILPLGTIPGASAPSAAQVADAVYDEARADHKSAGSFGELFNRVHADAANKKVADKSTGKTTVYEDDGVTVSHERTLSKVDDDKVALTPV